MRDSTFHVPNEAAFLHLVEVEITFNGKRHRNKSWSVTVPWILN